MLTDEQQAIVNYFATGKGDLLIQAGAGTGKTFTLIEGLKVIPQKSILMCAYNKRIATELQERVAALKLKGKAIFVKTFHAIGLSIIKHHYKHLDISGEATENLINRVAGGERLAWPVRRAAVKVLRQLKEVEAEEGGAVNSNRIGLEYDLFGECNERQIQQACELVDAGYRASLDPAKLESIDFCDMVWMPIALGLDPPSRYQAIIVDEWQDLSEPQWTLLRKLRPPNGRMLLAGDRNQAINAWRGAATEVVEGTMREAKQLPLTLSFRCAKSIVSEANQLVPSLRAHPDAIDGSVTWTHLAKLQTVLPRTQADKTHTFVLGRNNEGVFNCAMQLWKNRVDFQLNAGREMVDPLLAIVDKPPTSTAATDAQFKTALNMWLREELAKAARAGATAHEERCKANYSMLNDAIGICGHPSKIRGMLQAILEPNKSGILLSTVHKVKGLEADRVYLLRQTFDRHRSVETSDDGRWSVKTNVEELNIEYVAITRARENLVWIDMDPTHAEPIGGGGGGKPLKDKTKAQLQQMLEECEREAERLMSIDEGKAEKYMERAAELRSYAERNTK